MAASPHEEGEEGLTQRSWEQENLLQDIRKIRQDLSKAFEMIQPVTGLNLPRRSGLPRRLGGKECMGKST